MDETMALLTGLLATAFAVVVFCAALGGAWMLGRGWNRRGRDVDEPFAEDLNARKISVLMTRIDELALELERSLESQRYLAKMLTSDQRDAVARAKELLRAPERVVTPH